MVAVALVGFSVLLFSFGTVSEITTPEQNANKKTEVQELQWYFHNGDNTYTDMGVSENPPTSCTPPVDNPEICLKGFTAANDPGLSGAASATGDVEIERQQAP